MSKIKYKEIKKQILLKLSQCNIFNILAFNFC